jgi:hypothetical protein
MQEIVRLTGLNNRANALGAQNLLNLASFLDDGDRLQVRAKRSPGGFV